MGLHSNRQRRNIKMMKIVLLFVLVGFAAADWGGNWRGGWGDDHWMGDWNDWRGTANWGGNWGGNWRGNWGGNWGGNWRGNWGDNYRMVGCVCNEEDTNIKWTWL